MFVAAMIIFVSGHIAAANILVEEVATGISTGNHNIVNDSLKTVAAPVGELKAQKVFSNTPNTADTLQRKPRPTKNWSTWRPDPHRAMWLALVIPGAGQIYNRKFWKLPIFYGGIMGCIYAMQWNNMMYKDYAQAYLDIMDDNPQTQSYNQFLHLGRTIDSSNEGNYKTIFKKRKDYYRRYRDMSFFVLIGVYALSVIDAYVDAELSVFDISRNLSMKIEPAIINSRQGWNSLASSGVGLNCCLDF